MVAVVGPDVAVVPVPAGVVETLGRRLGIRPRQVLPDPVVGRVGAELEEIGAVGAGDIRELDLGAAADVGASEVEEVQHRDLGVGVGGAEDEVPEAEAPLRPDVYLPPRRVIVSRKGSRLLCRGHDCHKGLGHDPLHIRQDKVQAQHEARQEARVVLLGVPGVLLPHVEDPHILLEHHARVGRGVSEVLVPGEHGVGHSLELADGRVGLVHLRLELGHLVGGHAGLADERLFRFEFPERPGALMAFLTQLGTQWNISLFHYRNHGAAYGRVLVGLQLGSRSLKELKASLDAVGYPYSDESANPAYQLFLR